MLRETVKRLLSQLQYQSGSVKIILNTVVRIFLGLILFLLVAVVPTNILAREEEDFDGARERLEELREKRKEKIDELRQRRDEKREELRERKEDLKEKIATRQAEVRKQVIERIKKVFAKMLARLEAALLRLDKIAERIATRIDKLKDKGVDTSAAEQQLTEAEALGATAAQSINDAKVAIDAIDSDSTTVRDGAHAARDAVRGAKQALKNYHKALVEAIRELKAARDLREATDEAE